MNVFRAVLQKIFDEVMLVDVLDSGDTAHLAMMKRPDLGVTFTKLHCWTLTHYSKCVFMDADTLVSSHDFTLVSRVQVVPCQNMHEIFMSFELHCAPLTLCLCVNVRLCVTFNLQKVLKASVRAFYSKCI